MRILFFDDDFRRHADFRRLCWAAGVDPDAALVRANTIDAAKRMLSTQERFDWAFLDHDLDGQVGVEPGPHTGLAVAQYIAQMELEQKPREVVLHSMNAEGVREMMNALRFTSAKAAPFGTSEFAALVAEMARQSRQDVAPSP